MDRVSRIVIFIPCHDLKANFLDLINEVADACHNLKFIQCKVLVSTSSKITGYLDVIKTHPFVKFLKISQQNYWCMNSRKDIDYIKMHEKYDYIILMNDDTQLISGRLLEMIESINIDLPKILVGNIRDEKNRVLFGAKRRSKIIPHKFVSVKIGETIETFNGNILSLSRDALDKLGNLDNYEHAYGDYDLGLRAYKKGIEIKEYKYDVGLTSETSEKRKEMFKLHKKHKFGRSNTKDWQKFYSTHYNWLYYLIIKLIYQK